MCNLEGKHTPEMTNNHPKCRNQSYYLKYSLQIKCVTNFRVKQSVVSCCRMHQTFQSVQIKPHIKLKVTYYYKKVITKSIINTFKSSDTYWQCTVKCSVQEKNRKNDHIITQIQYFLLIDFNISAQKETVIEFRHRDVYSMVIIKSFNCRIKVYCLLFNFQNFYPFSVLFVDILYKTLLN